MVVDLEQYEPLWRRHLGALIVGGFVALLAVIVLLQLLDQGDVQEWLAQVPEEWAYVLCFLLVWFDAIIPIFPGETTLNAASTLAARGISSSSCWLERSERSWGTPRSFGSHASAPPECKASSTRRWRIRRFARAGMPSTVHQGS